MGRHWSTPAPWLLAALSVTAGCDGGSDDTSSPGGTPGKGKVAYVTVTPSSLLVTKPNEKRTIEAVAYDEQGNAFVAPEIAWTTTHSTVAAVDGGEVTAGGTTGSSLVIAEVDGVRSAPVLVLAATPAPDAVLLDDSVITSVEVVEPVDVSHVRWTVQAKVAPPPVGTIVLARESKAVAGRVTASSKSGGGASMTVERVPLTEAFTAFSLNEKVPVARGGLPVAHGHPLVTTKDFLFGPFECETEAGPKASLSPAWKPSLPSVGDLDKEFVLEPFATPAHVKMFVTGTVKQDISLILEFAAGLEAELKCHHTLKRFPLPLTGPLSAIAGLNLPVGIGFDAKIALEGASAKVGVEGAVGFKIALGFERKDGVTTNLTDLEIVNELTPVFEAPPIDSTFRFKASFFPHLFTSIDAGITYADNLNVGVFLAKGGIVAELDASLPGVQVSDPAYASSYGVKLGFEVGPGSDAKKLLSLFDEKFEVEPKIVKEIPISRSPTGTMTISQGAVPVGATVTFTTVMDADNATFLTANNIDTLEIREVAADGSADKVVKELKLAPGSLAASWSWSPTDADLGDHTFAAFVRPFFFSIIPLEITGDSRQSVFVHKPGELPPTKQVKYKWKYLTEMNAKALNNKGHALGGRVGLKSGEVGHPIVVVGGTVQMLPNTLDPKVWTHPYDINDDGTVVGGTGGPGMYATNKALMWVGGTTKELSGTPPSDPANFHGATAHGVNNAGDVVGVTEEKSLGTGTVWKIQATLWPKGGGAVPLGAPYEPLSSPKEARAAWRINDTGQIIASDSAVVGGFGGGILGFSTWDSGSWTNTKASNGMAINILGQVAGCLDAAGPHAALFSMGAGKDIDPDTTGKWISQAVAINDAGVVVAERKPKSSNGPYSVFVYAGGQFVQVPLPSTTADWEGGVVPPNMGTNGPRPIDIDNSGRILVQLGSAGVMLTPVP